jgi:2-hydroxychromene-2-carboxylate isomerase
MAAQIDFYFDFISPYSYLANVALPRLVNDRSASIRYRPFALLELMQLVGNRPTTVECKNKGRYAMTDIRRWAKSYRVPFVQNPHWARIDFPQLGRAGVFAIGQGRGAAYVDAIFDAVWAEGIDLSQRSLLIEVLEKAEIDGADILERAASPDCVAELQKNTREAAERGAFGSPTIFVGNEMFFGNDRLDFVAEALRGLGAE